jgi:hypothetical protein
VPIYLETVEVNEANELVSGTSYAQCIDPANYDTRTGKMAYR